MRCSCPYNTDVVPCVSSTAAVACVKYCTVLSMDITFTLSGTYKFTHPPEDNKIIQPPDTRRLSSLKSRLLCRREASHLAWLCLDATHVAVSFSRQVAHCDRATSPTACAPFPFEWTYVPPTNETTQAGAEHSLKMDCILARLITLKLSVIWNVTRYNSRIIWMKAFDQLGFCSNLFYYYV